MYIVLLCVYYFSRRNAG